MYCSQWLIFSISTKQTLFWWVGGLCNHLRTEVTIKPLKKWFWSFYIYQVVAIISKFSMAQKSVYTKYDRSQSFIFQINTKQTLFWWVGGLCNHLSTEVTTRSEKKRFWSHYIYQIGAIMSKLPMAQKSIYTKINCSQWLILAIRTKQTLFWWVGGLCNYLRTEVTTKSVKNRDLTTYIKLLL